MSLSNNYPTIQPTLNLSFALTKQLDPRITFTRTSTATYYDGVTTAMAEQNLLTYSQEFDNAAWSKSNTSVTANSIAAPDGSITADKLVAIATSTYHNITRAVSFANGVSGTISIYVKASEYSKFIIGEGAYGKFFCTYDLANGTVGTPTGSFTGLSASIQSTINGFYRCVLSFTSNDPANITPNFVGYPDTGATLNVYGAQYTGDGTSGVYIWGAQIENRSTATAYTSTTTQPITNYIPVLLTAAAGIPRFNHNPTTGESLGLLIEESRTNLLTYSEQFDNADWVKTDTTATANTVVAPDGALTADKLIETATLSVHRITAPVISVTSGTAYTATIYLKAGERSVVQYSSATNSFPSYYANFNLAAGVVSAQGGSGSAAIASVGNGWYRCIVTQTAGATGSNSQFRWQIQTSTTAANNETYTGDGFSGVFLWGAQLEAGSFATSYIPTVAATVTRSADSASMTGTNFSSWYRPNEGVIYVDALHPATAVNNEVLVSLDDSSAANTRISLYCSGGTNQSGVFISVAGATQASITGSNITNGLSFKVVAAYKVNDFAFVKDAAAAGTDTSGTVPVVGLLNIGKTNFIAASGYNGTIKKIAYYPARLTNAQLQALTTV